MMIKDKNRSAIISIVVFLLGNYVDVDVDTKQRNDCLTTALELTQIQNDSYLILLIHNNHLMELSSITINWNINFFFINKIDVVIDISF